MAQRTDEHKNKHKNDNNNNQNNNNNKDKKKEDNFIRVPTTDMRVGAGTQIVVGGDRPATIAAVHHQNIPIQRMIEIDLIEVVVTEGPYKGATVFHPYPKGADIKLFKTEELTKAIAKEERRRKLRETKEWLLSKVTFGLF